MPSPSLRPMLSHALRLSQRSVPWLSHVVTHPRARRAAAGAGDPVWLTDGKLTMAALRQPCQDAAPVDQRCVIGSTRRDEAEVSEEAGSDDDYHARSPVYLALRCLLLTRVPVHVLAGSGYRRTRRRVGTGSACDNRATKGHKGGGRARHCACVNVDGHVC